MGLCASNNVPEGIDKDRFKHLKNASKTMDQGAKDRAVDDKLVRKLLLLGAGESGKSTLFKQMISIYGDGFTKEQFKAHRKVVHNNVMKDINNLISQLDEFKEVLEENPLSDECEAAIEAFHSYENSTLVPEIGDQIRIIWEEPAIQHLWEIRNLFQISDSAAFFLDKVETVCSAEYLPDEKDMINSRVRTTGIVQTKFTIEGSRFQMFDVGGQRNERKKWIHCFENVTVVIFVAAISEYDQVLDEDNTTSRVTEALNLFGDICNSQWFVNTDIILFLNKKDLFEMKLKKASLSEWMPDYKGADDDIEAGQKFFKDLFFAKRKNRSKKIYSHVTCATDKGNVNHVFDSVMKTVISGQMKGGGFL